MVWQARSRGYFGTPRHAEGWIGYSLDGLDTIVQKVPCRLRRVLGGQGLSYPWHTGLLLHPHLGSGGNPASTCNHGIVYSLSLGSHHIHLHLSCHGHPRLGRGGGVSRRYTPRYAMVSSSCRHLRGPWVIGVCSSHVRVGLAGMEGRLPYLWVGHGGYGALLRHCHAHVWVAGVHIEVILRWLLRLWHH